MGEHKEERVSLENFKALTYGGIIFYMLVSYADYLSFGDCVYINVAFTCLLNGTNKELAWFPCYLDTYPDLIGCYVSYPDSTCLSPGYVIPGGSWLTPSNGTKRTLEELTKMFNGGTCLNADGSVFDPSFYGPYDPERAGLQSSAGELQCRIGYSIAKFATITVLILLIGVLFDELWDLIDEHHHSKLWDKLRYPAFVCNILVLIVGIIFSMLTHWKWIYDPPQGEFGQQFLPTTEHPCTSPTRIGTLLGILAFFLLVTEVAEGLYHLISHQTVEEIAERAKTLNEYDPLVTHA